MVHHLRLWRTVVKHRCRPRYQYLRLTGESGRYTLLLERSTGGATNRGREGSGLLDPSGRVAYLLDY